jgi:hypothetical protein
VEEEAGSHSYVEEDVRLPSHDRLRRPWRRREGEPLAIVLRPGSAGSNTAADHIEAARLALPSCRVTCGAGYWSPPTPAAARTGSWNG